MLNEHDAHQGPCARMVVQGRESRRGAWRRLATIAREPSPDLMLAAIEREIDGADVEQARVIAYAHGARRSLSTRTWAGYGELDEPDEEEEREHGEGSTAAVVRMALRLADDAQRHGRAHTSTAIAALDTALRRSEAECARLSALVAQASAGGLYAPPAERPDPERAQASATLHHALRATISGVSAALTGAPSDQLAQALHAWVESLTSSQVEGLIALLTPHQIAAFRAIVSALQVRAAQAQPASADPAIAAGPSSA